MSGPAIDKVLAEKALQWFQGHFNNSLTSPFTGQFPGWPLPKEIQRVHEQFRTIRQIVEATSGDQLQLAELVEKLGNAAELLKRILLTFRRYLAADTERLTEKTFHLALTETIEAERKALDALANSDEFGLIADTRLPHLKDFLPSRLVEASATNLAALLPRQYDEKFQALQAPGLFLPDLAYFRAKCDEREAPVAIAFLDIDDFKVLNTRHSETKVDRNLLPRFMQAIEAHVFHHGFAYRQGGEEYLILVPSLSRALAVAFFEELRQKLAGLTYPEIPESTTVSIGLCIAEPDCPLTDRELRDRANKAERFAKGNGKNCIATYGGPRMTEADLQIIARANSDSTPAPSRVQ